MGSIKKGPGVLASVRPPSMQIDSEAGREPEIMAVFRIHWNTAACGKKR